VLPDGYSKWLSFVLQQKAVETMGIWLAKIVKWQELTNGVMGIFNRGFLTKNLLILDMV